MERLMGCCWPGVACHCRAELNGCFRQQRISSSTLSCQRCFRQADPPGLQCKTGSGCSRSAWKLPVSGRSDQLSDVAVDARRRHQSGDSVDQLHRLRRSGRCCSPNRAWCRHRASVRDRVRVAGLGRMVARRSSAAGTRVRRGQRPRSALTHRWTNHRRAPIARA